MANFVYTEGIRQILLGNIDWAANDIRVLLVSTNTTADTDDATGRDANFLNGITLDEYDGANYVRKAFANESVTEDNAANTVKADVDDVTWNALGAGTRSAQAALVYKHVTDDTDAIPLLYIDTGGFPFAGNGSNVTLQLAAAGMLVGKNQ